MTNNKILKNASWIIVCRIFQSVLSFIISLFTARYLGPSNYGLISYAASIVAFVTPLANLGLNNILVQETVQNSKEENKIYGTAIVMSIVSSLSCIVGIFCFTCAANYGEKETIFVCVLYSIILVFQALELIQYWFQAQLLSKYTAIVSLCAYVVVTLYKLFLLISGKEVYWFAISNALDYMIISISLFVIYKILNKRKLQFSFSLVWQLLSKSKYYIISNIMIAIFGQIDKIMLKQFFDEEATGYYSAAVVCATFTSFVFSAIIDSFRPVIIEKQKSSQKDFEDSISKLYSLIVYAAFAQSIIITVFAPIIINVLFGEAYSSAIVVLRIIVWFTAFSYYGGSKAIWILAEGKQKYLIIINVTGAIVNIIINLIFIPAYGLIGAAIASLITQIFTNIIMEVILKPMRYNSKLLLRGLNPVVLVSMIKNILNRGV